MQARRTRLRTTRVRQKVDTGDLGIPPIRLGTSGNPIYITDAIVSAVLIAFVLGLIRKYTDVNV